jgi:5-methyltetrahydropteroyltriglutamate--homocysteine methyltransferase
MRQRTGWFAQLSTDGRVLTTGRTGMAGDDRRRRRARIRLPCSLGVPRYRNVRTGLRARERAEGERRRAMTRTTPPYRADHVGSFLRPERLIEARDRRARGEIPAAALRTVENEAIREVVRRQEEVGLSGITDGEFRRTFFHVDFLEQLDGVEVVEGSFTATFRRDDGTEVGFKPPTMRVTAPLRHSRSIQGQDFEFLKSVTARTPKVCIPSPSMLHFRGGRQAISAEVYPELDAFYTDLAAAYRAEVMDLAARGCRYLQLDDTNLAYLCDDAIREATRVRGDDPDELPRLYCRLINEAITGRPDDMAVCIHLCRGNYQSAWVAQGGYEPVAEILFNELEVDGFFLEYDDRRSGDFAPLRFVPKGKIVVLGIMSSKRPEIEAKDALKRRIDDAARYVPLDQLCLSHQCGFSSTVHGNLLSEADQWKKLARTVEVAREVWGE